MKHPILAHLHTARQLGHLPRRPVYAEYLGTVIGRTECRSCGARLAAAGAVVTITAMLASPCPGGPAAAGPRADGSAWVPAALQEAA